MQRVGAHPCPVTDEDRGRNFRDSHLYAAADPTIESVSITASHEFYTQGSESCVPTAHVSSVNTLARIRGTPFARKPGAGRVYRTTQIRQGLLVPGVGLPNAGSNCGVALAEMRDPEAMGVCADDDVPDTNDAATRNLGLAEIEAATIFRITNAHRIIFEEASDPVTALRSGIVAALKLAAAGKSAPPTACMTVDDAYGNLPVGAVYSATGGNVWGGHCQLITEYSEALDALGFATSWDAASRRIYYVSLPWFAKNGAAAFVVEDYAT